MRDLFPMGTKYIPISRPRIRCQEDEEGHIKSGLTYLFPWKANFKHKPRNSKFLDFEKVTLA